MSRVLVTGGAGFIGSHVVDKLIAAGHEPVIFDLRPSPYTTSVDTAIGDMCALDDVLRAARLRRDRPPRGGRRRRRGPSRTARPPSSSTRRGTVNVLEAARRRVGRVVYASTIWVYSDVEADAVDEATAARAARAPLHRDEARGRALLPLLPRALQRRGDRPALRHPVRPARPAGGGDPDLRAQGARGRAAHARRRRRADAPLRLRRGPRRRRRRGARARAPRPHLQPRRRRGRHDPRDRRARAATGRRRRDRRTRRAARATSGAPRSRARAPRDELGWTAADAVRRGPAAATWPGIASAARAPAAAPGAARPARGRRCRRPRTVLRASPVAAGPRGRAAWRSIAACPRLRRCRRGVRPSARRRRSVASPRSCRSGAPLTRWPRRLGGPGRLVVGARRPSRRRARRVASTAHDARPRHARSRCWPSRLATTLRGRRRGWRPAGASPSRQSAVRSPAAADRLEHQRQRAAVPCQPRPRAL